MVQRLQSDFAVRRRCDPRIVHDSVRQRLRVLEAVTYMRDGYQVHTQANGINETVPDALARAPAYADLPPLLPSYGRRGLRRASWVRIDK